MQKFERNMIFHWDGLDVSYVFFAISKRIELESVDWSWIVDNLM